MDSFSHSNAICMGELSHCELDRSPVDEIDKVRYPLEFTGEVFFVVRKTLGFANVFSGLPYNSFSVDLQVWRGCWETGVDLGTGGKGGDCYACPSVALNIELCCEGKVRYGSGCILVTFHMMELCWER